MREHDDLRAGWPDALNEASDGESGAIVCLKNGQCFTFKSCRGKGAGWIRLKGIQSAVGLPSRIMLIGRSIDVRLEDISWASAGKI